MTERPLKLRDEAANIVLSVQSKGAMLWVENGQLRYRAPKDALAEAEKTALRECRDQVISFLEKARAAEESAAAGSPSGQFYRAPLAFSQMAHWHMYLGGERPAIRQIASATRLSGRLNICVLRRSLEEVIGRHDALRTRLVTVDGVPVQQICAASTLPFAVDDLTTLTEESREMELKALIEKRMLEAVDFSKDSLIETRLVKIRRDEHVLLLLMEHMISDAASMSILLREIFEAYAIGLGKRTAVLRPVVVQFSDYAAWQRRSQEAALDRHWDYWNENVLRSRRLRFPEDDRPRAQPSGWATVPFEIESDLKVQLREWGRLNGTTLVFTVFTAYVALLLRWCDAAEGMVQYQSDGRDAHEVANAIGFFASVVYVRMRLNEEDTFVDLAKRVVIEFCRASDHADYSYLWARFPELEVARSSVFNWIPQGAAIDLPELDATEYRLRCSAVQIDPSMLKELMWDNEPGVVLYDDDSGVIGHVIYPAWRFSEDTMERFAAAFLVFLLAILNRPGERIADIVIV